MSYGIGLDCGTTSVGWSVVELNSFDEPMRIINLGSRIFTSAEHPKTGASLALPRRMSRSLRRRIRRHRHRNERIRNLIVESGLLNDEELSHLFDGKLTDIYELRTNALDRLLTNDEFARVLIHLSQRRGFKSNRKKDATDKDTGKLLTAVSDNTQLMSANNYRTVGEMFYKDEKFAGNKRNKGENYSNTVSRAMIENEVHCIFNAQRNFGNLFATQEFENRYCDILLSQRAYDEGPGGESKYGGNLIEKMMGQCTFFPDEKRAVKASYSFQLFTLWQKINNLRITSPSGIRALTDDERNLIFDLAHQKTELKYSDFRKSLNLADNEFFNSLNYSKGIDDAEKVKFNFLKAYHKMRKALDKVKENRIKELSRETLNEIGYIFTVCKNDDKILENLKKLDLTEEDITELMNMDNFSKVGHISVKACDMLIPYLEKGMRYDEACKSAGIEFRGHTGVKAKFLPGYSDEISDLRNPVVKRSVTQTIKVINAIIREQGESPVYVNIELARELSKPFAEREKIRKNNESNQEKNTKAIEDIKKEFDAFKIESPKGQDLVKMKLWKEQDGICPYSQEKIEYERLFEIGYVEVDHVFPYSISFDDTYKNKVLVKTRENRLKGNRLPLQYLTGERREKYIVWVNASSKYSYQKKQRLLKENITEDDRNSFKPRALQDTQYLSRFLYNYINDYLEFAPSATGKIKRVNTVNGAITAYMRKRWGIRKIREDGDLHHAADATVIACVTNGMIKRISDYSRNNEIKYMTDSPDDSTLVVDKRTGEVMETFPMPWNNFRKELEIRLSNNPQMELSHYILPNYLAEDQFNIKPCFVSRMPNRKIKGVAHKETIRSPKMADDGYVISKKPLTALSLDKDGEIQGYYNKESDKLLYNALKEQLLKYGGKADEAFAEPFYKPKHNGELGPEVKKVKIIEKSSLNVDLNSGKGVADNGDMVRIDVFYVENDGYYFVPIYIADTVKKVLPNKAVVANKNYSDWKEMKEEDFIFSLYANDLILVKSKKAIEMSLNFKDSTLPQKHILQDELLYYSKAGISTGSITVTTHDNSYIVPSLGIKKLLLIEKYEVDVLGNVRKVGREKRQGFGN